MAVEMKGSRMHNKFFSLRFISFLLLVILLVGCATRAKRMTRISLGMSKEQVVQKLDDPTVARGAIRNKFDQSVEVWEYRLALPNDQVGADVAITVFTFGFGSPRLLSRDMKDYWLYFVEDKLVRWGEAGDWEREANQIYEFQFNPSPQL